MNFIKYTMSLFASDWRQRKTAALHGWAHFSSPGGSYGD